MCTCLTRIQSTLIHSISLSYSSGKWGSKNVGFGGAVHPGYFDIKDSIIDENTFRFAAVTDMDQLSRVTSSKKPLFESTLLPGRIQRDPLTNRYSIHFEKTRTLTSQHNEAGRGMELSELTHFQQSALVV